MSEWLTLDESDQSRPEYGEDYWEEPDLEAAFIGAWFDYDIYDAGIDGIIVECSTNDNLDRGYPSEYARWTERYKTVEEALKRTGKSRTGVSGTIVTVRVNSVEV